MLRNYEKKQRTSFSSGEELANTLKNLVLESKLKSMIVYAYTTLLLIKKVYF